MSYKEHGKSYVVMGSIYQTGIGRYAVVVFAVEHSDGAARLRTMAKRLDAPDLVSARSLRLALSIELANEVTLRGDRVIRVEKEADALRW